MNIKSLRDVSAELTSLADTTAHPIVYVMGVSGAGKSYSSAELSNLDPNIVTVSFDWWIKDPSRLRRTRIAQAYEKDGTMPDPLSWYNWSQFKTDILALRSSGKLKRNDAWNQLTGEKDLSVDLSLPDKGILLVEGMYLMENSFDELVDYSIIIYSDPEVAIQASSARRAHDSESTYRTVKARWIREYDVPYIERYLDKVDAVIMNDR